VEASWKWVGRIHQAWAAAGAQAIPSYEAGTWGPAEADRLLRPAGMSGGGRESRTGARALHERRVHWGVDVASIEKELAGLWAAAGDGAKGRSGEAAGAPRDVSRACLWNLVVWTEREAEFARAKQLVDAVTPACPARVLMLNLAAGAGKELDAWVSANCHLAPGAAS